MPSTQRGWELYAAVSGFRVLGPKLRPEEWVDISISPICYSVCWLPSQAALLLQLTPGSMRIVIRFLSPRYSYNFCKSFKLYQLGSCSHPCSNLPRDGKTQWWGPARAGTCVPSPEQGTASSQYTGSRYRDKLSWQDSQIMLPKELTMYINGKIARIS